MIDRLTYVHLITGFCNLNHGSFGATPRVRLLPFVLKTRWCVYLQTYVFNRILYGVAFIYFFIFRPDDYNFHDINLFFQIH